MKYLLDANIVIALLNDNNSAAARRVRLHKPIDIGISVIVAHELFYGAFKSLKSQHSLELVDSLQFEVVDFDREDARQSGEVRAALARLGTPIGPYDVLIAGQLARNLTLVTDNRTEFTRIAGLQTEDWV